MQIGGTIRDAVVVSLEVDVKQLVRVYAVAPEGVEHLVGAKVGQRGVVDLDVAQALVVQRLELLAVRLGQVGEEVVVARVGAAAIGLAGSQTQVEVARGRHGELAVLPLLGRDRVAQQLPVVEVRARAVGDLALAHGAHGVLLARLLERRDGRGREAGELPRHRRHLPEAPEALEEAREVVLAVELARRQRAHSVLLLLLDYVIDGRTLG